jgi:hypothetical protein
VQAVTVMDSRISPLELVLPPLATVAENGEKPDLVQESIAQLASDVRALEQKLRALAASPAGDLKVQHEEAISSLRRTEVSSARHFLRVFVVRRKLL